MAAAARAVVTVTTTWAPEAAAATAGGSIAAFNAGRRSLVAVATAVAAERNVGTARLDYVVCSGQQQRVFLACMLKQHRLIGRTYLGTEFRGCRALLFSDRFASVVSQLGSG